MICYMFFLFYMKQKVPPHLHYFIFIWIASIPPASTNYINKNCFHCDWPFEVYQLRQASKLNCSRFSSSVTLSKGISSPLDWPQLSKADITSPGLPFTSRCIAKWPPSSSASWPYLHRSQPTQSRSNYKKVRVGHSIWRCSNRSNSRAVLLICTIRSLKVHDLTGGIDHVHLTLTLLNQEITLKSTLLGPKWFDGLPKIFCIWVACNGLRKHRNLWQTAGKEYDFDLLQGSEKGYDRYGSMGRTKTDATDNGGYDYWCFRIPCWSHLFRWGGWNAL